MPQGSALWVTTSKCSGLTRLFRGSGMTSPILERSGRMEEVKSEDKKKKFALYIHDSALDVARQWYARDNCASISEFIEKAVLFYGGYVANEKNQNYLPNIVISTLKSIMRDSENRHNRNLYRIALEMSMLMNVIAATHHIPEESLVKLRGTCEDEIKRINGTLSLDTAVQWQS